MVLDDVIRKTFIVAVAVCQAGSYILCVLDKRSKQLRSDCVLLLFVSIFVRYVKLGGIL